MKIIEARNLSKLYKIQKGRRGSIKETVIRGWFRSGPTEELWALKDISFSLEGGVTLGIIGPNGSGKSTLLKIITGITPPTEGGIAVQGKVASLLELGAGFTPELTGLENIYMNGSVLGLEKKKIDAVRDEIIAFADLEQFIYMPVKHYSSGMLMRLGFSVAIHVDPDILVLDEIMAVGDSYFQEKSAEKILEFKKRGKTILLVSHQLDQVERVADRVLWLDQGRIKLFGKIDETITGYMREYYDQKLKEPPLPFNLEFGNLCQSSRLGSGEALINKVVITNEEGREVRTVFTGETLRIEIHYEAQRPGIELETIMGFGRLDGVSVFRACSGTALKNAPPKGVIVVTLSPLLMKKGRFQLSVALNPPGKPFEPYDLHLRYYEFQIASRKKGEARGVIIHPVRFELKEAS